MPIRWDPPLTRRVALELDRELEGAHLRALRLDGSRRNVALIFRERTLLCHLHPTMGQVQLLEAIEPADSDLRLRARLRGVSAPPDERLLRLDLGRAGGEPLSFVVELYGNQWNALAIEGEGDLAVIRHVLWRREGGSPRAVGLRYEEPSPTHRIGVDGHIAAAEWRELLSAADPRDRPGVLVRNVAWTSSVNARAILGDAALDLGDQHLESARARWTTFANDIDDAPAAVLDTERGPQPYPAALPGVPARRVPSVLAAMDACLGEEGSSVAVAVPPFPLTRLETRVDRLARRATRMQAELDGLADPDTLRATGDLILARYGQIPTGAESAVLDDFDGSPVEVALDPSASPHDNARRYYDEASKAERAAERLPGLIAAAQAEARLAESLLARARAGDATEADVLEELGPVTDPRDVVGRMEPALPYRTYRSSGGLEIRVGKGARQNDDLTFRHASPNDVWLHARHAAGAHVILRWNGPGNPPARDLREAAILAALASKARTSGSAPVDWTLRKYVRKPRKSPAGRVVAERLQTVFVQPDPDVEERLRAP